MKKSFTLIELIVVIAIIAVLAAIVAPNAFKAIEKAKVARIIQDSKTIEAAAYHMYTDTGYWPGSNWADDLPPNGDRLAGAQPGEGFVTVPVVMTLSAWNGPYIEKWLKNPWGGAYYWDYNEADQNGDGLGQEHVLWVDNSASVGPYNNANNRVNLSARLMFDRQIDDGNLTSGRIQVWQGNATSGNLGFILIQGQ
jgi:prepilin-type N-terminal cleavage/methylation domain-containing protein